MNRNWVKSIIVVVGLASLVVYLVTRERALSAERAAHAATLEELWAQVDRLGQEQRKSALASRVSAMQMMRAQGSSDSSRSTLRPPREDVRTPEAGAEDTQGDEAAPPLDPAEQARADLEEFRGLLEDTFTAESVDASWAPDAEDVAFRTLSAALPESSRLMSARGVRDAVTVPIPSWRRAVSCRLAAELVEHFAIDLVGDRRIDAQRRIAILQALGMHRAFGPGADLSGISDVQALQLSAVAHQAFIAVDEAGTEAAAATAVVAVPTSTGPQDLERVRVDRPFLFLIRDRPTNTILFLGRVVNPPQQAP